MKTVSTKLDKQTFEKFQEMCNHEGQCMSESLRDLIKMSIQAYKEGLEMEQKATEPTGNTSRPEPKVTRISYDDGKTWYDASQENKKNFESKIHDSKQVYWQTIKWNPPLTHRIAILTKIIMKVCWNYLNGKHMCRIWHAVKRLE